MDLKPDCAPLNSTDINPFVAVEFDIFMNPLDPSNKHVGIDINPMESIANVRWWSNVSIMKDRKQDSWINYDSASKNLTIPFAAFRNNINVTQRLSYIVDLRQYLPELVIFGFSAVMGNESALHSIYSWSFSSNLEIHGNRTDPGIDAGPNPDPNIGGIRIKTDPGFMIPGSNSSKNKMGLVIGLTVGCSVLLGGPGLLIFGFWKKRRVMNEEDEFLDATIANEFERGSRPKNFSYNELDRATNKFDQREKLGEGGFGGVYKGFLKEINSYVAVKRVSKGSRQGIKEYAPEVKIISRLRHKNLAQLLGWCHEKKELLLVYEFMPNGSLDSHLFKLKSQSNWEIRFKIAQGLAAALLYLHEEWEQCVVHRDIKSSNVMLEPNCNVKLADFRLARLVDHEKGSQTTVLAGMMGYMAPKCVITGKASEETDVFSFGVVVALEIATGRRPMGTKAQHSQVNLIECVWSLFGTRKLLEAVDPQLGTDFNEQEMQQLMIVGLWCAHLDSNLCPSIRQATRVLNFEAPLPILPLRMLVPTYCAPQFDMLSSIWHNYEREAAKHRLQYIVTTLTFQSLLHLLKDAHSRHHFFTQDNWVPMTVFL